LIRKRKIVFVYCPLTATFWAKFGHFFFSLKPLTVFAAFCPDLLCFVDSFCGNVLNFVLISNKKNYGHAVPLAASF
jgi:hypothetical protein